MKPQRRRKYLTALRLAAFLCAAATSALAASPTESETQIRAVIQDKFMEGYSRSDAITFVSGDEVTRGWQTVLDRYKKKYSDREKMGTLTFADLEITVLGPDSAVALGRWELKRAKDQPRGRFTLIFRKSAEGWRIVHDHTSAAP
jgi:ketosteroid isomerase-like protein